jgi:serine/threonine protein kinase
LCLDDEDEAKLLPQLLLGEAEVLQFLEQNPHPNIVRFHGCTANRGRFTGIALERHSVMLQYRHEDVPRPIDIDTCMRGIRAALTHLHSLGFAHNDINPTNIAIDGDDKLKLLDFGSCRRFGEDLIWAGTHGWIDKDCTTSAQSHDELAADKIEAWLQIKAQEQHWMCFLVQSRIMLPKGS